MRSLQKTLLAAFLFLGTFSLASAELTNASPFEALESRLQQLKRSQLSQEDKKKWEPFLKNLENRIHNGTEL